MVGTSIAGPLRGVSASFDVLGDGLVGVAAPVPHAGDVVGLRDGGAAATEVFCLVLFGRAGRPAPATVRLEDQVRVRPTPLLRDGRVDHSVDEDALHRFGRPRRFADNDRLRKWSNTHDCCVTFGHGGSDTSVTV